MYSDLALTYFIHRVSEWFYREYTYHPLPLQTVIEIFHPSSSVALRKTQSERPCIVDLADSAVRKPCLEFQSPSLNLGTKTPKEMDYESLVGIEIKMLENPY